MKPGIKTSEFWFLLLVTAALLGALFCGKLSPEFGSIVIAILPVIWTVIRQAVKNEPESTEARVVQAVEQFLPPVVREKLEPGAPLQDGLGNPSHVVASGTDAASTAAAEKGAGAA